MYSLHILLVVKVTENYTETKHNKQMVQSRTMKSILKMSGEQGTRFARELLGWRSLCNSEFHMWDNTQNRWCPWLSPITCYDAAACRPLTVTSDVKQRGIIQCPFTSPSSSSSSSCLGLIIHEGSSVYRIFKRWQAVNQQWKVLNYEKSKDLGDPLSSSSKTGARNSRGNPHGLASSSSSGGGRQSRRLRTILNHHCGYTILHILSQLRPNDPRISAAANREVVMRVTTVWSQADRGVKSALSRRDGPRPRAPRMLMRGRTRRPSADRRRRTGGLWASRVMPHQQTLEDFCLLFPTRKRGPDATFQ